MIHAVLICQLSFRDRSHCLIEPSQHVGHSEVDQVLHATPPVPSDGASKDIFPHLGPTSWVVQLSGCTRARGVPWPQGRLGRAMARRVQELRNTLLCLRRRRRRERAGDTRPDPGEHRSLVSARHATVSKHRKSRCSWRRWTARLKMFVNSTSCSTLTR